MRTGSAIANGTRQYAVSVNTVWEQLESSSESASAVAETGLAATMPVNRWKGQMGVGSNPYDYVQGLLIQNRSTTANLFVTTLKDASGAAPSIATARATANAILVGPGASLRLDNTDATKVWLQGSGALVAAILAT